MFVKLPRRRSALSKLSGLGFRPGNSSLQSGCGDVIELFAILVSIYSSLLNVLLNSLVQVFGCLGIIGASGSEQNISQPVSN